MKFKTLVLFAFFLVANFSIIAQKNGEEIPKEFFKIYENNPMQAIDYVFSTNKWLGATPGALENIKTKLQSSLDLVGSYQGHEVISSKRIGESYGILSYLAKYERQPIRFIFILYKPDKKWQVQNFKFDDAMSKELEESVRLHNIKDPYKN